MTLKDGAGDPLQISRRADQFVAGTSNWVNVDQAFGGFGVEPSVHVFPIDGLAARIIISAG